MTLTFFTYLHRIFTHSLYLEKYTHTRLSLSPSLSVHSLSFFVQSLSISLLSLSLSSQPLYLSTQPLVVSPQLSIFLLSLSLLGLSIPLNSLSISLLSLSISLPLPGFLSQQFHSFSLTTCESNVTRKKSPSLQKLPKNDFTRKNKYFDTFTKIA